ncbi:MAG: exodeoxyribonuclease VII small subunit [Anaerolineales bacterium]|jgi:exodeoxyribonuclease VII small subunit
MAKNETKPIEEFSYEEAYTELEKIVTKLEAGEQPLEEAVALFERGQKLTRHCAGLLDKAELKIQQLSGEKLEPFQESE